MQVLVEPITRGFDRLLSLLLDATVIGTDVMLIVVAIAHGIDLLLLLLVISPAIAVDHVLVAVVCGGGRLAAVFVHLQ